MKSGREQQPVDPAARRKQMIVGLVVGILVGVGVSLFTQFWWWLPAGIVFGLTMGALMKPPSG